MPANLPPEAKAKLAKYSEARTLEEKIRALEEFISAVPKHKGTENLLLWARRRLAELREELETRKRKKVGGGPSFFVEKSGAGQVVILGPPNSGKSSVLAALTNARPEIADYPFTTKAPQAGMAIFEDVQIQLVDTPPIIPWEPESPVNSRILGLARNADTILLVFGLDDPSIEDTVRATLRLLESRGIVLSPRKGVVRIVKVRGTGGIKIRGEGRLVGITEDDVRRLLAGYRIYSAVVEIDGEVTADDIEAAIISHRVRKRSLALLNKADVAGAGEAFTRAATILKSEGIPFKPVSALKRRGLEDLPRILFEMLGVVRVYTKQPLGEPSPTPLVLPRGSTVLDVAERIHKDLARKFKYAKVWGPSAKYPGQRVGADHVVSDGDVVEIHAG